MLATEANNKIIINVLRKMQLRSPNKNFMMDL